MNTFLLGQKLSGFLRFFGVDIRRKLFSDIIDELGGELKSLICGGAFLSDELMDFYDSIGINIIQGYGITECSPIVSCNTDRKTRKLGEVGPYCAVKCVNGEICVSGDNVMMGYYKNPDETQKVIVDGWFHTGDLGNVDKRNCLSLSGRIKNLIINSNGENISSEEIENHLAFIDLIANAVVYGEDDLIAVEIYPNHNYIEANGIIDVEVELHRVIDEVNKKLPRKMHIERIHIRKEPFDMTTTMKIKRHNLK
jgi:long-chain acyl-CoA synthetase